ncbi:GNAT family N-acetyltransferase [Cryobacterium arcticum]|uniref:GNAT family N-acetyltransferase n=1 Tax=Cryobacterium arcticum TaxID=670052 RepID=A0A317ZT13_9MICO|nr:GNAT family N-acetyltransferase [Cryobacterium arcticum]PXA67915.1 GNAT family N-acetyltransferase [Cryobacterium arcticum]
MESPVFSIDEVAVPAEPGAPGWADFEAAVLVRNTIETDAYGTDVLGFTAVEVFPSWLTLEHSPRHLFVAKVHGRIVARALYETLADPSSPFAWFTVEVLPEWRRNGIGTALTQLLESRADAEGRSNRIVYAVSPDAPGRRLVARSGFGSVPRWNPEVRFLLGHGYSLEQVERGSRLPLPLDVHALDRTLADAQAAAGSDYTALVWTGRTPQRWLEDLALLYTRMSTDAPTAGLEEPEDVWSVERLVAEQEASARGPRIALVAAAMHRPSGRLAGFTELSVPADPSRAVSQEDTLVLKEHRGHRLGMLVKAANLRQLALQHPEQTVVTTFNAEENRYMLDVNEALGFVPMGYEGAWRRVSAAAGNAGSSATTGS